MMESVKHSGGAIVSITILPIVMCPIQPAFSADHVADNTMLTNDNAEFEGYFK